MARYQQRRYRSFQEFETHETPRFDSLSDAIDGLMDAVFLDEIARQRRHEKDEDDLFEAELDFAYERRPRIRSVMNGFWARSRPTVDVGVSP
jgi:hypothetical protein